jgi:NTE family protein
MDFNKVDEIYRVGYYNTLRYISGIKNAVNRRISKKEILQKRMDFRNKTLPLRFVDIHIPGGGLNDSEKEFIIKTIKNNSNEVFNFEQLKRGFYRVIATENIGSIYPDVKVRQDSLFDLYLQVKKNTPMRLSIGGNISSSSLNQGYLGFQYNRFSKNPWRASADVNIGRFYSGVNLMLRQDIGIKPLWFYEARFTAHIFDYFNGNQTQFFANRVPSNIRERETFITLSAGTPLNIEKSILARFSIFSGINLYEYYQTDNYTSYDIPDRTEFEYISPAMSVERNTTNYKIYPTEGKREKLSVRFAYINEEHTPGSTSLTRTEIKLGSHTSFSGRAYAEHYYKINRFLTLGLIADLTISNRTYMGDHISTLLYLPAFQPNPHSKTLLLNGYRAPSFVGIAISPIIKFSDSFSFHLQGSYFQPGRQLIENTEGIAKFTEFLPEGSFMANIAAVWQSPVGPVSLSASYYQRSDVKWFPQLNIGFLIFKSKALVY